MLSMYLIKACGQDVFKALHDRKLTKDEIRELGFKIATETVNFVSIQYAEPTADQLAEKIVEEL